MDEITIKKLAKSYISKSNDIDYEGMAALFSLDAEWIPISPMQPRRGRAEIKDAYLQHVKKNNRPIINDRYFADGNTCLVEFEVVLEDNSTIGIIDVFTFNERGEIVKLKVYKN
ncbi:MAG: nuclear transport factor 2 family protein [Bacteroidota bacterium]